MASALAISTRCCSATDSAATRRVGSTSSPHALEQLAGPSRSAPRSSEPKRPGSRPRNRFSATVRCGRERELLVDHRDAEALGVPRAVELDQLAGDLDLALIGSFDLREELHQRRLAGAVLARDDVDLPG